MTPVAMEHRHRLADVLGHVDEVDYHTRKVDGGAREVELRLGAIDERDPPGRATCTVPKGVRLFFVGGPISLSGGGEAGGNWIRQGVVRSGGGAGGRRYFCRQRPMGDFRWSSRAS